MTLASRRAGVLGLRTLGHRFRALVHADFRRYWIGQLVSVNGTWMQSAAQGWLLYRLTDQALWLGALSLARFGPSLLLSPVAGVLADRWDRRRLVLATQTTMMVLAAVLAVLTLGALVTPHLVLAVALLEGFTVTFDMPARQALQLDLVGSGDLPSAVGLNSVAFNLARMVGPAVAGFIVAAASEGWCFAVNAVSFLGVLAALVTIAPRPRSARSTRSLAGQLAEVAEFVRSDNRVAVTLAAVTVTAVLGLGYSSILPVVARDVLHGDARTYGWLLAAAGAGAVVGALQAAGRSSPRGARWVIARRQLILGAALLALALGRSLAVDLAALALAGFAISGQLTTTNSYLQMTAPEALRGRVLSIYVWLFAGSAPLSGLAFGALTDAVGVAPTVAVGGTGCALAGAGLLAALLVQRRRRDRASASNQGDASSTPSRHAAKR